MISFDPATLAPLRRIDPSIMVGLLGGGSESRLHSAGARSGRAPAMPEIFVVTPELVEQAHRADLQVVTWTVNSAEDDALDDRRGGRRNHDRFPGPAASGN